MRRIRRRRGGRRLGKSKKDWIVGPWEEDRDQPLGGSGTQFYTLIDGAELEEKDDKLTVLRVVGDIWTIPVQIATGMALGGIKYWQGIKVFETDNTGAILPQFPVDAVDADASWMYLRVGWKSFIQTDIGGGARAIIADTGHSNHFYSNSGWGGDHIDIQVKRRLEANEVLLLAMGADVNLPYDTANLANNTSLTHAVFVRTLVGNL